MIRRLKSPLITHAVTALNILVLATFTLLVLPIHMGLSAGIAATSIIIFSLAAIISIASILASKGRARVVALGALVASITGLILPQLLYASVARSTDTRLSFEPQAYVRFAGETELKPSGFHTYKTVGQQSLMLAVYSAGNKPDAPKGTIVILHGGGWRYGNYLETGNWPRTLSEADFTIVSVQYRLSSPENHTWNQAPQDIHDALRYIQAHPKDLGVNLDRLYLLGQSAGGHLALLEAYKNQTVTAVASLYAPVDLALDYETSRDKSAELNFIGGTPEEYPERYRDLSPLTHTRSSSPRTLILQGTRDDLVTEQNALLLSSQLKKHNVEHRTILLPLTGHSFENQHGGFATQIAEQSVLKFFGSHF